MSFFDALGSPSKKSLGDERYELVEGMFSCQRNDCWESTNEAKYFDDALLLTWKCPAGHVSKITDFEL